jgi:hypothetical protein
MAEAFGNKQGGDRWDVVSSGPRAVWPQRMRSFTITNSFRKMDTANLAER